MLRAHRLPLRVLLTLLLSAAIAAAGAATAHAGSTQVTILQDDGHVLSDPVGTMETLRSLGVTKVRIFLQWGTIAPNPLSRTRPSGFNATDPGAYAAGGWLPYDTAVQVAHDFGIGVYFDFLGPAPLWAATRPPHGSPTHNPSVYAPSGHQFGDFVGHRAFWNLSVTIRIGNGDSRAHQPARPQSHLTVQKTRFCR